MQPVKSAESDEQGKRTRKEGKWESQKPRSGDVQSIRSQKQEGRTNREAAETQDHSAPPSVVRIQPEDISGALRDKITDISKYSVNVYKIKVYRKHIKYSMNNMCLCKTKHQMRGQLGLQFLFC